MLKKLFFSFVFAFSLASFAHASTTNLGLSQTSVSMNINDALTIPSGSISALYISGNNNPTAVIANILNGNQVSLHAYASGSANIIVCNSSNICDTIYVTVAAQSTTQTTPDLVLSATNVTLESGESKTISITGGGGYTISSNSNTAAATAFINGNNLYVQGFAAGGTNVSVCQGDGKCKVVYVYVNPTSSSVSSGSSYPIALTSFSVASNVIGNSFFGKNSTITIGFSADKKISNAYVTIGGQKISASGSDSGPYHAVYTATGNETSPLPIILSFVDVDVGISKQILISYSDVVSGGSGSVATPSQSTTSGMQFVSTLSLGDSGDEVLLLQKRLVTDGFLSATPNGHFGPATQTALKAYQKKNGLSQAGVVGPATRALLNKGI